MINYKEKRKTRVLTNNIFRELNTMGAKSILFTPYVSLIDVFNHNKSSPIKNFVNENIFPQTNNVIESGYFDEIIEQANSILGFNCFNMQTDISKLLKYLVLFDETVVDDNLLPKVLDALDKILLEDTVVCITGYKDYKWVDSKCYEKVCLVIVETDIRKLSLTKTNVEEFGYFYDGEVQEIHDVEKFVSYLEKITGNVLDIDSFIDYCNGVVNEINYNLINFLQSK